MQPDVTVFVRASLPIARCVPGLFCPGVRRDIFCLTVATAAAWLGRGDVRRLRLVNIGMAGSVTAEFNIR